MAFTSQPGVAQPGLFHPGNLESDTAAVTGADTGSATTENYTLTATVNQTDSASGAESQTLSATLNSSDAGSGADAQSILVQVSDSDTGSGLDEEAVSVSVSEGDTGSSLEDQSLAFTEADTGSGLEDDPSVEATLSDDDTGSALEEELIDDQSESTPDGDDEGLATEDETTSATLLHDDEVSVVEFEFIEVTLSDSDAASGTEALLSFALSDTDEGSGEETEDHEQVYLGSDTISVEESYSIAVTLSSEDELYATDTHQPFPAGPVEVGDYQVSLVMGPATVYVADFETTEPLDSEISSTPAGNWLDIGSTLDGVVMTVKHDFESIEVAQKYDRTASRLKRRHITVDMSMAEPTLLNMLYALNSGALEDGSGYTSYSPPFLDRATPLTYRAVIIDGWAPGFSEVTGQHRRRRIILRKCLSTEDTSMSYTKDKLTAQSVTWTVHRVDDVVPPLKVIDEE